MSSANNSWPATGWTKVRILILIATFALLPTAPGSLIEPIWALNGPTTRGQPKLAELVRRVGPNMRASADYHDFEDVGLNESIEAWRLLRNQAEQFAKNQVKFLGPKVRHLLMEANVSSKCLESIETTLSSMKQLEPWAIKSKFRRDLCHISQFETIASNSSAISI